MALRITSVYDALLQRARSGLYRPGERFMSNRAVATRFGVSYQTAHRLLTRLVDEKVLTRSDRSGTYLAGRADRPSSVRLVFHARASAPGSFGSKLLSCLRTTLEKNRIKVEASFDPAAPIPRSQLPILWESPAALQRCMHEQRRAILINDRPSASLEATVIDSVAIDDFAGGVMAAQYLMRTFRAVGRIAVIGGPKADRRSQARIAGFTSEVAANVIHAKDWFEPDGEAAAERVVGKPLAGVFCCNDRLAEGFLRTCKRRGVTPPPVIGFDNAPIAEQLGLTTVAIPWDAMAAALTRLARERLGGSVDPATHLVLFPLIVPRHVRL